MAYIRASQGGGGGGETAKLQIPMSYTVSDKSVSNQLDASHTAAQAFDGSYTTAWLPANQTSWGLTNYLFFSGSSLENISTMIIYLAYATNDSGTANISLAYSNDGSNYQTIGSINYAFSAAGWNVKSNNIVQAVNLGNIGARFWRIGIQTNSGAASGNSRYYLGVQEVDFI